MKIFACTLNWNAKEKLEKLYSGLIKNFEQLSTDAVWHVKDNGSKDDSVKFLQSCQSTIAHDYGHNRDNFSKGINWLFDQCSPSDEDLILLLNNDVEFKDNNSLKNMVSLHKKTNSDIVGTRLLYPNSNTLQHAGTIFSQRYNNMPYHYRPGEKSDKQSEQNRYFQAVTAAVMLVKAKAFRDVGGFDSRFNWAFDDVDLCLRIGQIKKNNVVYCGQTNIWHEESASLKKNPINKLFIGSNVSYFKKKWSNKYELDLEKYESDPNYRLVK